MVITHTTHIPLQLELKRASRLNRATSKERVTERNGPRKSDMTDPAAVGEAYTDAHVMQYQQGCKNLGWLE